MSVLKLTLWIPGSPLRGAPKSFSISGLSTASMFCGVIGPTSL